MGWWLSKRQNFQSFDRNSRIFQNAPMYFTRSWRQCMFWIFSSLTRSQFLFLGEFIATTWSFFDFSGGFWKSSLLTVSSVTINDIRACYTSLWIFTNFLLILKSSSTLTWLFVVHLDCFICFLSLFWSSVVCRIIIKSSTWGEDCLKFINVGGDKIEEGMTENIDMQDWQLLTPIEAFVVWVLFSLCILFTIVLNDSIYTHTILSWHSLNRSLSGVWKTGVILLVFHLRSNSDVDPVSCDLSHSFLFDFVEFKYKTSL